MVKKKGTIFVFFIISLFIHLFLLLIFLKKNKAAGDNGSIHIVMEPKANNLKKQNENSLMHENLGANKATSFQKKIDKINDAVSQESSAIMNTVVYPPAARRMGWQGKVAIQVTVVHSRAESIQILQKSGHDLLDDAAIRALQEWKFEDSLNNQTFKLVFEFILQ